MVDVVWASIDGAGEDQPFTHDDLVDVSHHHMELSAGRKKITGDARAILATECDHHGCEIRRRHDEHTVLRVKRCNRPTP